MTARLYRRALYGRERSLMLRFIYLALFEVRVLNEKKMVISFVLLIGHRVDP